MRYRFRTVALLALLAASGWGIAAYEHGFAHFMGIDTQASQNYDFVSGVGPMLLTAIGLSTLIAGAVHALNCHQAGCWRVGRHKIAGTPWCNRHHESARESAGGVDLSHVLGQLQVITGRLDDLTAVMKDQAR